MTRPASRRRATIALHWSLFLLLICITAGAEHPAFYWAFALCGAGICALALAFGLMGRPGPKLQGAARIAHPWMHRGLYVAIAGVSALCVLHLLTGTPGFLEMRRATKILFYITMLHAVFHLWRHTALMDGALRTITPRFIHASL